MPPTDRLYQADSYLRTFTATVQTVRDDAVVLERTAFFPTGGGVLGDEGRLVAEDGSAWRLVETLDAGEEVLHRVEGAPPAPGTAVTGELDWARRYALMRYHTATHVLTGVMFNDFGVRVTGNQLTPGRGRVDFAFETYDRETLEEGFRRANAVVARDLAVRIDQVSAAEAQARPELFKLETGFRKSLETLRLVEIVGFDVQADGGCHVARLAEVGPLTLTKTENKGRANRRVYFELGGAP